jgi:hypothetical protein
MPVYPLGRTANANVNIHFVLLSDDPCNKPKFRIPHCANHLALVPTQALTLLNVLMLCSKLSMQSQQNS